MGFGMPGVDYSAQGPRLALPHWPEINFRLTRKTLPFREMQKLAYWPAAESEISPLILW